MTTRRQAGNLDVLVALVARGTPLTQSAAAAKMSRSTAYRHLSCPEVIDRVEAGRAEIRHTLTRWLDRITLVADLAAERAVDLLTSDDTPDHVVARIVTALISQRRSLIEAVEIDERLIRLEAAAAGTNGHAIDRLRTVVEEAP